MSKATEHYLFGSFRVHTFRALQLVQWGFRIGIDIRESTLQESE